MRKASNDETCAEDANENDDDYEHKRHHRVLQDGKCGEGQHERRRRRVKPKQPMTPIGATYVTFV